MVDMRILIIRHVDLGLNIATCMCRHHSDTFYSAKNMKICRFSQARSFLIIPDRPKHNTENEKDEKLGEFPRCLLSNKTVSRSPSGFFAFKMILAS
jgi:hypothetical protein